MLAKKLPEAPRQMCGAFNILVSAFEQLGAQESRRLKQAIIMDGREMMRETMKTGQPLIVVWKKFQDERLGGKKLTAKAT